MKTEIITLTLEERNALNLDSYPNLITIQYVWMGILALRGINFPFNVSDLNVQYLGDNSYEVQVTDYSLAV